MKTLLRVVLSWAVLVFAQMIAGAVVPVHATPAPNWLAWMLVTDLLIVIALAVVAARSHWTKLRLALALFAIPCGIALMNLVEGTVFLKRAGMNVPGLLAMVILQYGIAALAWGWLLARKGTAGPSLEPQWPATWTARITRFVLSDVIYIVIYFTAGLIIFPYVKQFYATQEMPTFRTIAGLQLLLRGPVFVAVCILLMRMLRMSRVAGALTVGLLFTTLSGIAPLLNPNPYFPDSVRWVHLCEVASSNFVFGAVVAWLFNVARPEAAPLSKAAAAGTEPQ